MDIPLPPLRILGHETRFSTSIGRYLIPVYGYTKEDLLEYAKAVLKEKLK